MKIRKIEKSGFEEIVTCEDTATDLHAIVAIHSTKLGPSLGGIRMFPYPSQAAALEDVMRLAKAMSYKSAAAHLKLGGGKAVILGDPNKDKTPQMMHAMGKFVDSLGGRYYSAKDAGIVTEDLIEVSKVTRFVTGLPESMGGSGDPSPWTALGILEGMKTCVQERLGRTEFKGLSVMIQGAGHVGLGLAKLLAKDKVKLFISDVYEKTTEQAKKTVPCEMVAPESVFDVEADIFSPCALGGILNDKSILKLKSTMGAGAANNQLFDEARHGQMLVDRTILYAPDYILNAGGVINIYVRDILKKKDPMPWILKISDYLTEIFGISKKEKKSPAVIANQLTEEILRKGL